MVCQHNKKQWMQITYVLVQLQLHLIFGSDASTIYFKTRIQMEHFGNSDPDPNTSLKPEKNYNRFNETQSALGLIIKDHCILNFMLSVR